MKSTIQAPVLWTRVAALVGVFFGLLTIREGGAVLFIDGPARVAAGDYVPFVLWFNFLAGFVYVVAGAGLWFRQYWAAWTAIALAISTIAVFAAFAWHVFAGGAYEFRTVVAMALRSSIWVLIAVVGWRLKPMRDRPPMPNA